MSDNEIDIVSGDYIDSNYNKVKSNRFHKKHYNLMLKVYHLQYLLMNF